MPGMSPASWALRFAGSLDGVTAVLSGMSDMDQVRDNIATMRDMEPVGESDRALLREAVSEMKEAGPLGESDFSRYEGLTYHGIPVAALLDTYNSCMIQPVPTFAGDLNYLVGRLLATGEPDMKREFPEEKVVLDGEDITARVKEAWDFLVDNALSQ